MNHYESFNDPFECSFEIVKGFPKKDPLCSRFQNIVKAWGFDDANDVIVLENYDDYVSSLEDSEPSIPFLLDSARISCFSKKGDILLMWTHYADGLRGFCVEFDPVLLLSENAEDAGIYEVLYENSPAVIDTALMAVLNDQVEYHYDSIQETKHLGGNRSSEIKAYREALDDARKRIREIYQKMLATRPKEWEYEEELRVISGSDRRDKSGEFLKYPPEAIRSVIVGEKMPIHQRQALMKAMEKHPSPINLKKASRVKGGLKIVLSTEI